MIVYSFIAQKFTGIYYSEKELHKAIKCNNDFDFKAFEDLAKAHNYIIDNSNLKPTKIYAVRDGAIRGIFYSWTDCQQVVNGYASAVFKGFQDIKEAFEYANLSNIQVVDAYGTQKIKKDKNIETVGFDKSKPFAYVDGSFNSKTKTYGYGAILVVNDVEHVFSGSNNNAEMVSMRNVSGEIEGSMRAISEAIKLGLSEVTIVYDYMGIQMWADGSWKRNKSGTVAYYNFIQKAKQKIKINFVKVKAHSNEAMNDRVDALAKKAVGI